MSVTGALWALVWLCGDLSGSCWLCRAPDWAGGTMAITYCMNIHAMIHISSEHTTPLTFDLNIAVELI